MRMLPFITITGMALLAGCTAQDYGTTRGAGMASQMPADMTPESRAAYVQVAAASDLFEIQSSQLALTRSQNADVRAFAQMMIDHHNQTSQQLMAAARAAGMTPPAPALMPNQAMMMERLRSATATNFDSLYVQQQVMAHEMALALHRNYASNGDTPGLRTVAAAAVPVIQQHLDRARQINR